MISRREFIAATGAAVTVSTVGSAALPESAAATAGVAEKSSRLFLPEDNLKPATYDRLPLEWHPRPTGNGTPVLVHERRLRSPCDRRPDV